MAGTRETRTSIWHRFGYATIVAMQIFMAVTGLFMISARNWKHASVSFLAVLLSMMPFVVNRWRVKLDLPLGLSLVFVLFLFLSFFIGEVYGVYGSFIIWDKILHFASGVLLVAAGFWAAKVYAAKAPWWILISFAFCFSLAASVVWEILEFLSDEWLGTYSQGASLRDTMHDIVANAMASLLTVVAITFWAKKRQRKLVRV